MFGGKREKVAMRNSGEVASEFRSAWDLTLGDMRQIYHGLPASEYANHFKSTEKILWDAVNDYAKVAAKSNPSQSDIEHATAKLNQTIAQARELDYPTNALTSISERFIATALDSDRVIPRDIRWAAACVGNSIGGSRVPLKDRVTTIAKRNPASKNSAPIPLSGADMTRADMADAMYASLGVANVRPAATLADRLKDHARPVTLGSVVAAVAASAILTPSIAHAAEISSTTNASSNGSSNTAASAAESATLISEPSTASKSSKVAISIDATKGKPDKPAQIELTPSADSPAVKKVTPIDIKASGSIKQDTKAHTLTQPSATTSEAPATKAPVAISLETTATNKTAKQKPAETGSLTAPVLNPDTRTYTTIDPNTGASITTELPKSALVAISEITTSTSTNGTTHSVIDKPTIESIAAPSDILNTEDTKDIATHGTPEQKKAASNMQQVRRFIINNDVSSAASVLVKNFHDTSIVATQFDTSGAPVYPVTNQDLVKNIGDLTAQYQTLIAGKGHKDAGSVNTALMALSVLKAAATDQSVLNVDAIKKLAGGVTKPTDEYQGKLFDQYVATAQKTLGDNKLLDGISDTNKPTIETMYAYVLMANVSDDEQSKQIQAIKDGEAATAAAKKAADEEAAREAARQNTGGPVEAQALQNLIDHASDMATKNAFLAMQYIMEKTGLNATRTAGILGNMSVESASSFDPGIHQIGGGPGRGMFQHEGGRFDDMQNYAAARGKTWDDFYTQLDFAISEMPGRRDTLDALKGTSTVFDAANTFMVRFETPYVVVHAYDTGDWSESDAQAHVRADRGQAFLDAYNNEITAETAARQAAAQKAAEEQKKKQQEQQNSQDLVSKQNRFQDSTGVECSPNTPEVRNDTGYYRGDQVPIKLCALPNTIYDGSPALVNARAASLAYAMFEQMRKDLGINIVTLNDAFRTMEQQKQAKAEYGDQAADPGWSNHQMGYAFDISMGPANGGNAGPNDYTMGVNTEYPGNPVWEWLHAHAAEYHFYQYDQEGWHWSINGG